jgi:hypothetical protein
MTLPANRLTFTAFSCLFSAAKALSMSFTDLDELPRPCAKSRNVNLAHEVLLNVCHQFKRCRFMKCTSPGFGGAVDATRANLTFELCEFSKCSAKFGGSVYSTNSMIFSFNTSTITESSAERFGALYSDMCRKNRTTLVRDVNISVSTARVYIGGVRVEVSSPNFFNVRIVHTAAPNYGALWDWTTVPAVGRYHSVVFENMTSSTEGCGMTFFHWIHRSVIQRCIFVRGTGPVPKYIYLYSTECIVEISDSYFDALREVAIGDRFGNNTFNIAESNSFVGTLDL